MARQLTKLDLKELRARAEAQGTPHPEACIAAITLNEFLALLDRLAEAEAHIDYALYKQAFFGLRVYRAKYPKEGE